MTNEIIEKCEKCGAEHSTGFCWCEKCRAEYNALHPEEFDF